MSTPWIPEHYTGRLRARLAAPVWWLLPSRTQRWLCGCADYCKEQT